MLSTDPPTYTQHILVLPGTQTITTHPYNKNYNKKYNKKYNKNHRLLPAPAIGADGKLYSSLQLSLAGKYSAQSLKRSRIEWMKFEMWAFRDILFFSFLFFFFFFCSLSFFFLD